MKKKSTLFFAYILLVICLSVNIFAVILFPSPFDIASLVTVISISIIIIFMTLKFFNIKLFLYSSKNTDSKIDKILNEYKAAFKQIEEKNTYLLERYNMLDAIRKEYKKDMRNVAKMQASLLPYKMFEYKNIDYSVLYNPSDVIGGDFYDFVKIDNGKNIFILSDISGHGINAAIISSMLKTLFQIYGKTIHSPRELLVKINYELIKCMPENYCLSAVVVLIDNIKKTITYSNASHPPFLILRKDSLEEISLSDTIVGLFPNADYHEETISLEKNDILLFYTDGITEASRSRQKKDLYGSERLKSAVMASKHMNVHDMINFIKHDFFRYLSFRAPDDDVTLIAFKIK